MQTSLTSQSLMHQLVFRHGTMGSAKTAHLLMMAYNLQSKGKRVCVAKPALDTRFGQSTVSSRVGISREVDVLLDANTINTLDAYKDSDAVFVDEAQFLSRAQIEALRALTSHVDVFCYGLRLDYRAVMFEGSRRLCELADKLEEIETSCSWCHNKALVSAKYTLRSDGSVVVIKNGSDAPDLGAEDKYTALCWACWSK